MAWRAGRRVLRPVSPAGRPVSGYAALTATYVGFEAGDESSHVRHLLQHLARNRVNVEDVQGVGER